MVSSTTTWTMDLVGRRAVDLVRAQSTEREARAEYHRDCDRFSERHGLEHIGRDDAKFHRATRKTYRTLCEARQETYNARRRLETAVRRLESL